LYGGPDRGAQKTYEPRVTPNRSGKSQTYIGVLQAQMLRVDRGLRVLRVLKCTT